MDRSAKFFLQVLPGVVAGLTVFALKFFHALQSCQIRLGVGYGLSGGQGIQDGAQGFGRTAEQRGVFPA